MVERARRHAVGGCLACVAGFSLVLVLAYWVGPAERLDRTVLDALSTPTDTLVNEAAYVGFLVVNFRPAWVLVGAITVLIALAQWRIRDAVLAAALVAGTGGLVLALKALLANPRYQPVPLDSDAYPWKDAFPSGHAAGPGDVARLLLRRPALLATADRRRGNRLHSLHQLRGPAAQLPLPGRRLAGWLLAAGWWFFLLAALPSSEPSPCPPRLGELQRGPLRRAPSAGRRPG